MTTAVPIDAESITADWLSEVLGTPVTDVKITALEGGVVSDVFRIHDVRYTEPDTAPPTTFVVKLATRFDERRQMARACGLYSKELNFFRLLATQTPIRSPTVYACVDDGDMSPERFAILMEDLSARSTMFDQVDNPPNRHDVQTIARDAARLHAHYWESDATTLPWLGRADGRYVFPLDALCRASPATFPEFNSLWRQMYGAELFGGDQHTEATQLAELLCGSSCELILDRIYDVLSSRPKTLLHGDMRADNIFHSNPSSTIEQGSPLTFIDWQLLHVGPPGPELTEAWSGSIDPHIRRNELALLTDYRNTLVQLNPSAETYSFDMLLEDYSLGYCFWLTTLITAGAATLPSFSRPDAARMKRLWETMMTRSLTAVTDLSCLSRVRTLLKAG